MREDNKGRAANPGAAPKDTERSSLMSSESMFRSGQNGAAMDDDAADDDREHLAMSPDMQQFIGRQLRAVYDDVAKQPVPDRFLELMKQLDNKTGAR